MTVGEKRPATPGLGSIDERMRFAGLAAVRQRTNAVILRALQNLLGRHSARVLDVGCGHGLFLAQARAAGFLAEGIEADAEVAPLARQYSGCAVRVGSFPAVLEPNDEFDAVIFHDVLEHLPDPTAALRAAAEHVRPGGVVALVVPDQLGIFFRLAMLCDSLGVHGPLRRLWQFGLPSHLWYFTGAHLSSLAAQSGLRVQSTTRLPALTARGLWARIAYVREQSLLLSVATAAGALCLLPVLRLFPRDTTVMVLTRPAY